MISLKELIRAAYPDYPDAAALPEVPVSGLECDSRRVRKGFLFVAIRGKKLDGRQFIQEAIGRGASAVVTDNLEKPDGPVPFLLVPDSRSAASKLAAAFYGNPSEKLTVIGLTGTNGKTTVSYLIEHLLQKENKKVGVIGTVNYRFDGQEEPSKETTPGPLKSQEILSEILKAGLSHAVMEVSSHALDQDRVSDIRFSAAAFTNLTQDHLDYHGTMEHYFESKAKLFTGLGPETTSVLNADDAWAMRLAKSVKNKIITYGLKGDADLKAERLTMSVEAMQFTLKEGGKTVPVTLPLLGRHNVSNALGALGIMKALNFPLERSLEHLRDFKGVPGRLERLNEGQNFSVLIDFAHTPDALENALRSMHDYKSKRLLTVFGCGGDRDKGKRPKMGRIAADWSDFVYVTSDNPRSEDPEMIAREICSGFPAQYNRYAVVLDRHKAIRRALMDAREGDLVLLAGKGHEQTQVIGDHVFAFSDRHEAEKILHGH